MDREKIDRVYQWDLSKIYGSVDDFNEDINSVREKLMLFKKYENIKYDSNTLYEILELDMSVSRLLEKLEVYVNLLCDEDTSVNVNMELKENINNLVSEYSSVSYFVYPSILKLDYKEIEEFYLENNKLKEYERYLIEMIRYKEHTLSDNEEKLLASMTKMFGNNYDTYELLKDCDMPIPSFKVNSQEYLLDNSKYGLYMEDNDREVRKGAFTTLHGVYRQFKNVYASLISANIKEEVVDAKIKKYHSAMEKSLYRDELDTGIYDNLVSTINKKIGVLHSYYALKKKVMGVDELHLYDVYANLVEIEGKSYPFEEAKDIVIRALAILGEEYGNIVKQGIKDRWIDVYPNKGKRTGGYSSGSYDTNPYILLNYQDKYDDMSTLAHELGHSMHSYYTRSSNPYQYGHYAIFVAEVASTVNELLLAKYVIKNSSDKNEKMFVLNRMMELFRATIYRQTMFSEFEKWMYDKIENDEALTADRLSDKYYELNKVYFGSDVVIDDEIRYEWERIPHFYYNFYVYKYATGLSAACYIVSGLLDGSISRDDYLSFLKCGSSKSPLDSLKLTGVDLSNPLVVESAIKMFEDTIMEFKELYFN